MAEGNEGQEQSGIGTLLIVLALIFAAACAAWCGSLWPGRLLKGGLAAVVLLLVLGPLAVIVAGVLYRAYESFPRSMPRVVAVTLAMIIALLALALVLVTHPWGAT